MAHRVRRIDVKEKVTSNQAVVGNVGHMVMLDW
jgi:hypothetical protein